jgi:NhaP-type Na+/H+ or K+/H+ antiporter
MDEWGLAGVALVLIGYAAVSGRLASTPVTQAMVFVAVGLLVGNRVLRLVEADAAGQFVRHLAEATLALVLFCDAVRVNLHRLRRESLIPARLLGIGLPLTIVAGTLAGLALLPGLDLWTAAALGGSGFIAAFVAGITFGAVADAQAEPTTFLAEQSGELLNAVTFLLFGAVLLGPALGDPDWRIIAYAVLSLTVVRMLPVALAMVGTGMRRVTVGFLGWFGPRGLASIVFVLLLVEQTGLPERPLLLAVVTWTVALSVYAHGLTALPGANRYADWYAAHAHHHEAMPESAPVPEPRPRLPARSSGP